MDKMTREEMKTVLLENECIVDFKKINGDKRSMPCTLNPALMPKPTTTADPKKVKEPNPLTLNVWCTDKKEWRSFRIANVTNLQIISLTDK